MSLPPPGFYPDPEDAGQMRWWDGSAWTEHRQGIASTPTAVGAPASAFGPDGASIVAFAAEPARKALTVAMVVSGLMAVGLWIFSGFSVAPQVMLRLGDSVTTMGVVTEVDRTTSTSGTSRTRTCEVFFEFQADGRPYAGSTGFSSNTLCGYESGQDVVVRYSPEDPSSAVLDEFGAMSGSFLPLIIALGATVTFFGVRRKRARLLLS